jgi:NADH:ubiquinone reductase (non-electrogenic)
MVSSIDEKEIHFKDNKQIAYDIAIWCGGIKKSALTDKLLQNLQIEHGKGIPVDIMLQVEKTKNVYAMGDCAFSGSPPTAQVAFQQGKYLATMFNTDFMHKQPFRFINKGQIGYVGMKKSVCQLPYFQSAGNITYYLNKGIHLYNAVNWKQRFNIILSSK